jgi:iron only hydrogenase large subunit-like protein
MPCYDKKLEAVRPDFKFAPNETKAKEVDTVLATHEIIDLLNKLGVNFVDIDPQIDQQQSK